MDKTAIPSPSLSHTHRLADWLRPAPALSLSPLRTFGFSLSIGTGFAEAVCSSRKSFPIPPPRHPTLHSTPTHTTSFLLLLHPPHHLPLPHQETLCRRRCLCRPRSMSDRRRKGKEKAVQRQGKDRALKRATDPHPPEEVTAQLVFEPHRPFCAPLQQRPGDIPILHFNLGAPQFLDEYIRIITSTLTRARNIAPALLLNKPITPMGNPCNNPKPYSKEHWKNLGNSHYIIETRYTQVVNGKVVKYYDGLKVRILFCDYNGYQIAFSRYLNKKWSVWYYCSEHFPIPFFLRQGAIKLEGVGGDYTHRPRIGGWQTFHSIFMEFGHYPEKQSIDDLNEQFLASAVVLCEARRIVWIFQEVKERIRLDEAPRHLDCKLPGKERTVDVVWTEIGDWGSDCGVALEAARVGEYKATTEERGYAGRRRPVVKKFSDLIAADEDSGHLCLLMRDESIAVPKGGWLETKLINDGLDLGAKVADPGFPDDVDPKLTEGTDSDSDDDMPE
uniref:Uncharacterized protein n=1 Tax=Avena sativa TaxID=4498 RepID=A0ACD5XGC8_AVESA